jgi:hypothetical protein
MITNLNSWSFEPSSNKSVESFDPSIPIPSDDQPAAETLSAVIHNGFPAAAAQASCSPFFLAIDHFADSRCPSFRLWDFATFLGIWLLILGNSQFLKPLLFPFRIRYVAPVSSLRRSMNLTHLTFPNPLRSRVRTPSNVNQNFFYSVVRAPKSRKRGAPEPQCQIENAQCSILNE